MNFYESISEHYHHIFPLNNIQVEFVKNSFHKSKQLDLLDIGCGTGSLSFELSKLFHSVTAIDLDKAMLHKATKQYASLNLQFRILNMLEIENTFGVNSFDAIMCFGNTLVHLNSTDSILDFFIQSKNVLKEDGKLLIQIINYDRILDEHIKDLPTIENEFISFERNYHFRKEEHLIDFETILNVKETGQQIKNTIPLYPIRKSEIDKLLRDAGFSEIKYFGNFKKEDLETGSIPFIVETF